jgi:RND family efflux transporter MFP subunit
MPAKKIVLIVVALAALGGGAWYYNSGEADPLAAPAQPSDPGGGGRGGRGGRAGGLAMTVESASVTRHEISEAITVVGNLIGEATVDVVPRLAGRLETVDVKLGDRISRGQQVAKMDDRDIREQVSQANANLEVNKATARTRESDLKVAETTLARQKNMFTSGLSSKQNLEDAEARYNAAISQVDVAKAQVNQTQARIEELKVTLGNTSIISPVDGFVGRRNLDAGAFAGTNSPVVSVVDISTVRLVANLVEKDFRRIRQGLQASVEVDAFPGEKFTGKVSRVAPIFDAATRTAVMEIEIANPGFRLKPGMYARVSLTVDRQPDALTVPRNSIVDLEGKRGVYVIDQQVARFRPVKTGLQDADRVQVLDGLDEGQRVVTTGALAIKDGDRVQLPGAAAGSGSRGGRSERSGGGSGQGKTPGPGEGSKAPDGK